MKKEFEKRARLFKWFGILMLAVIGIFCFATSPEAGSILLTAIATVPVWGSIKDNTFKELSIEEFNELSAEDQVKYFNDLNQHRANKLEKMEADLKKSNSDEIKTAINTLKDEIRADNVKQLATLQKALEEQGNALNKILADSGSKEGAKTIKAIVEENKDALKALANGGSKNVTIKVLRSDITDHTLAMRLTDVGQKATRKLKLRDIMNWAKVSPGMNGAVRYVDQNTTTRNAAWKGEGVAAPESAITWVEKLLSLQEIKDSIPVSRRSLIDVGFIESEIRNFLMKNIDLKVDQDLWNGSGVAPIIKGVYTYATAFTNPTTGTITAATIWDLARESIKQVEASTNYEVNYILMSPTDYNTMVSEKDANNNYIIPPFARWEGGNLFIENAMVVKSAAITANTMLVGDFTYATIYQGDELTITIGEVNNQFKEGMVTMLGTEQLNLLVRSAHEDAFIKVADMAASITAITA